MEIKKTDFKRSVLVEVQGRIDSSNAQELGKALDDITHGGKYKIVVDLRGVDFMASRGYWALIQAQKTCKRYNRGEVVLVGVEGELRESLKLIGLEEYFKIFDDTTPAVGYF